MSKKKEEKKSSSRFFYGGEKKDEKGRVQRWPLPGKHAIVQDVCLSIAREKRREQSLYQQNVHPNAILSQGQFCANPW